MNEEQERLLDTPALLQELASPKAYAIIRQEGASMVCTRNEATNVPSCRSANRELLLQLEEQGLIATTQTKPTAWKCEITESGRRAIV